MVRGARCEVSGRKGQRERARAKETCRERISQVLEGKPDFVPGGRDIDPEDPSGTAYYDRVRRGESKKIEDSMPPFFRHDDESMGLVHWAG